ncbi:Lrp/AsnC family transcriptional regulator [Leifsonia aquatica]|jgi:DNA-binding Lrp family transcriptional regulator|uniref:Transcriptional regulator, AsnC family n=2 Tax=Leifsonia aquatica TaxID=144185 RepID=U2R2Z1_LEIAQ|nr:Lrp/AsnC family transcriptional regulator [Leifsonia aquatica]ERK69630.1 transcriptional regulator, AsnC family [Leifsonia aquatica ATCC 14665]MBB2965924.1 DNA-binding Lrp family transcriptional regulator [Leifsonia aquatica]
MRTFDSTDRRILVALADDPRSTNVSLADRLGLSRNTVQARLAELDRSGAFLSFERRIDARAAGYPLAAYVTVHVQQQLLAAIVEHLTGIPEIVEAHGLSGSSDLLLRVLARDAEDLFRITGAIQSTEGVVRAETSLDMGELIPFRLRPLLTRD